MLEKISRRSFLVGGTALTMGAALGVVGCAPAGTNEEAKASSAAIDGGGAETKGMQTLNAGAELNFFEPVPGTVAFVSEKIKDEDVASTEDCDVVVCGLGLAGIATMLAATSFGLKVIALEKTGSYNVRGTGIGAPDCRLFKEAGASWDEEEILNDMTKASSYRCNADIWKSWFANNGEAVDWLLDQVGDKLTPYLGLGPNGETTSEFAGVVTYREDVRFEEGMDGFAEVAIEVANSKNVDIRYNTPACQIVQGDSGKVVGVIARDEQGSYVKINASKGVVLCTGGYENNWDMMCENMRREDLCVAAWRLPNTENTGDGHMMGMSVGGLMDPYPHIMMRDPGASVASNAGNKGLTLPFPRVNESGLRYVNESIAPHFLANSIQHQTGGHDFMVLAGPDLETIIDRCSYRNYAMSAARMSPKEVADLLEPIADRGETVEELCEATGIDAENLKKTLARLTELHEKGVDEDWGGDTEMFMDYSSGPYFAFEESGSCLVTVSGLRVTVDSEVIDKTGMPIPGLYAVGNCSGEMFSDTYPHDLQAISHSRCVVFGYVVAKKLSQQ